jgi:hypothetical protein
MLKPTPFNNRRLRQLGFDWRLRRSWRGLRQDGAVAPALPDELRSRLLAIPAGAGPLPRSVESPLPERPRLPFTLRSPSLALCTSYVCVLVLTAVAGNPYRIGVRTVEELQANASPIVDVGRGWISRLQEAGSGLEARLDDTLQAAGEQLRPAPTPETTETVNETLRGGPDGNR